jgi:hypothetical protein
MSADKEQQQGEPLAKKARTDSASSDLEPPTTAPFPLMEPPTTAPFPVMAAEARTTDLPEDDGEDEEGSEEESDGDGEEGDEPLTQDQIQEAVDIMFNLAYEQSPAVSSTVGALSPDQQRYFADRLAQTKREISAFVYDYASRNPSATVEDVMSEVGSVMSPGQSPER